MFELRGCAAQTTTTSFVQSPAGIATIVVCTVVGAVILGLIGYGIYKCCTADQTAVNATPTNTAPAKDVVVVNEERPYYPNTVSSLKSV